MHSSPPPSSTPLMVPCPQCRQLSEFSPANPWRPFCSERCRMIDLGAWANEEFRIAAKPELADDGSSDG